ncbi:glycoside hydrolase family 3 C-terminal domain-containing protein [Pseudarthrobacter defluvii]|uniref:glycoside hydrolase family 3 C-terminal domain-containing protein n=1 Tax=Pseudarthrobacter defluvii TaxID=410837 RepID=UPI00257777D3|nr:glycoside hydrolase family 3 C-terminal domain-containing protein [Pseudarthrobacter defluvii]WJH24190.1 glycoside hydrolase family 3 protein [Pseudarthrobacter defluvii]
MHSQPATAIPAPPQAPDPAPVLLRSLTLEQKIAMLHQHAPAVPELGLAPFHTGAEAAHGVAWLGPATVFPQPVGMAATWDPGLIEKLGGATGRELRAKKADDPAVGLNAWAPVVNPLRHPLWGRNEEGFSEDPHLTAELAGAYCRGLKGKHPSVWLTVPTLKHFLGYNNERDRNVTSSNLSPRVLHEYELPAYRSPIEEGVAGAVMLSYNLINGRPAHVSDLVQSQLRQWRNGDSITVVTDAGAPSALFRAEKYFSDGPSAYAAALQAGVDNFTDDGEDSKPSVGYLTEAFRQGLITEADVDRAVFRLLSLRARTGEFAGQENPYSAIGPEAIGAREHVALAREAAAKSVVLLRNEAALGESEPLLPLHPVSGSVAVIGTLGSRVLSDWYSGTLQDPVSIAEAFTHGTGDEGSGTLVEDGVDVVAFRCVRTDGYLGADGGEVLTATAPEVGRQEAFAVKDWGGGELTLQSPESVKFVTHTGDGYLRATADRIGGWVVQETFRLDYAQDGTAALQHVGSGRWVRIEAGTGSAGLVPDSGSADRFLLRTLKSGHEAARRAAEKAATAVVVVGNDPHLGGRETLDRLTLDLPLADQELVRVVREANPRTVLVIVSSYPYALGALADTPAIAWTSHGGQELGNGVAEVLTGAAEPYGRLPQTWFARTEDLPDILDYDIITSRATYLYSEAEPLYPLGHGLSYAQVQYESMTVAAPSVPGDKARGSVGVNVSLRNAGTRPAAELVQVYATAPNHRHGFPRRRLVAHTRIDVPAPGTAVATVQVPLERLATFSVVEERMVVEPGTYQLLVGASAENLPLHAELEVPGHQGPVRATGCWFSSQNYDSCGNLALVPETPLAGTAISPADTSRPAWATYSGWDRPADEPCNEVLLDVVGTRTGGQGAGTARIQVTGPGDTWTTAGRASCSPGFTGELVIPLDPHLTAGMEVFRLVLEGPLVVSRVERR